MKQNLKKCLRRFIDFERVKARQISLVVKHNRLMHRKSFVPCLTKISGAHVLFNRLTICIDFKPGIAI